jgi:hypothetical protein
MKANNGLKLCLLVAGSILAMGSARAQDRRAQPAISADPLAGQFRDPPVEARPRVWWHWMNGNITQDGITKDLAWMKRIGIGGAQTFDAAMQTPQVVESRLAYMSPEWQQAFRFAASEAERLGLELTIASSPGFTETGGPWVPPSDAMKKLVWSETDFIGGRRWGGRLRMPPSVTGPYQTIPIDPSGGLLLTGGQAAPVAKPLYTDIAVLAWPIDAAASAQAPAATYSDGSGTVLDGTLLTDEDLASAVAITRPAKGSLMLQAKYPSPRTIRSATLFMPASAGRYMGGNLKPVLEASDDGTDWRTVVEFPAAAVPATVGFAAVTARQFRVVFKRAPGGGIAGFVPPVPGVDIGRMLGGGGAAMMAAPALKVADFRLSSEARIDRAETKAGFDIASDYFALPAGAPETPGIAPASVIDLTSRLRTDGTLDWSPPKSRWRVLRLGWSLVGTVNHPASPEATGLEVDKYDGAAVRRYLEHYIGMYRQAAGPELLGARGVRALLNDSIEAGAANWTPELIAHFKELRGYDPTPWLPALTGTIIESRAQSDKFLFDYRRTLSDLIASQHYGTIAKVAHENGLLVYGEAQENGRPQLGDDMAMRRHADIPMAGLWTYPRERGPQPSYLVDMRGAASVAHIYGKPIVAAESMTSLLSPWAFGPRDLKRVIDLEFATGINRPVIHTSVHVPTDDKKPGLSLSIFGQHFNRHEAWAELAKPWIDYIARNSLMMQQGRNVADIAYYYGEEAPLTGLYSEKRVPDAPKVHGYDFINSDALMSALTNDGADLVTPGGARYRALYLGGSSRMMTLATLRKLAALVEAGATVIGLKPVGDPGLVGDEREYAALTTKLWLGEAMVRVGKGRVIATIDAEQALAQIGVPPDFRFTGGSGDSEILFSHRQLPDGDSYFLSNRADRVETLEARFRVTGKAPELWHTETGLSEPVSYRIENGETVVPLTLRPDGSVHVVFRKSAPADALVIARPEPVQLARLGGPWAVAFEAGRGAPPSATLATLAPLNESAIPGIRYFSGIATYSKEFRAPKGWHPGQSLWLDLGEAREIAEISINGRLAGAAWQAPYRVDIGAVTKAGRNHLQIRVANLWVNRMIGDAQPGATKVTWTATPTYTANAPLKRSGLIGPVTLSK